jgi:hypothetical protein
VGGKLKPVVPGDHSRITIRTGGAYEDFHRKPFLEVDQGHQLSSQRLSAYRAQLSVRIFVASKLMLNSWGVDPQRAVKTSIGTRGENGRRRPWRLEQATLEKMTRWTQERRRVDRRFGTSVLCQHYWTLLLRNSQRRTSQGHATNVSSSRFLLLREKGTRKGRFRIAYWWWFADLVLECWRGVREEKGGSGMFLEDDLRSPPGFSDGTC